MKSFYMKKKKGLKAKVLVHMCRVVSVVFFSGLLVRLLFNFKAYMVGFYVADYL